MVVQLYSKPHFGRARPIKVKEFHGHLAFSPAFEVSNQCKRNCSFVSFHTSIGMLFLIYSFCQIGRRRKIVIAMSLLFTVFLGLMRISQGRHFLSDVVFSACFMMITYYLVIMFYEIYCDKKYKSLIHDDNTGNVK
jgi:lipid A 4'-phosphatase